MSLWHGDITEVDIAAMAGGTLIEALGIEIVEIRDDALVGRMPRTGSRSALRQTGQALASGVV